MEKNMKRFSFFLALTSLLAFNSYGQRFGYVDARFILSQMPEYTKAEQEINSLSESWQTEISNMRANIQQMYDALRAEEVLLTKEMYDQRMGAIVKKEDELKDYQRKTFGYDGMLFLKRQELIKPLQDKVFEAVEDVAKKKRVQIIFDKSSEVVMIYTDPRFDYTDFVLEELGLVESEEDKF
jgi:outer membrane protein